MGFFGEGYYDATITKIERYKTPYGPRLMIWMQIKNEHDRTMLINHLVTIDCTSSNMLGKIYQIVFPGRDLDDFDTDDLIKKMIGVVLVKKIKKGKSFLNVSNFLPLKSDKKPNKKDSHEDLSEVAKQLASILQNNPALTKSIMQHLKKAPKNSGGKSSTHGVKKMDQLFEENPDYKFKKGDQHEED